MKLARKLTLALIAVMVVLMAYRAYVRVNADVVVFENDMRRDHRSMGRALIPAIAFAWREDGEARALAIIEESNRNFANVTIKWVWLDGQGGADHSPAIPAAQLRSLDAPGVDLIAERGGDLALHTYVEMEAPGGRDGALEVSESLAEERTYIRDTIVRAIVTTGSIVAICAVVSWWLGIVLIARPISRMIDKARRVGAGDFGGPPLSIQARDELSDLAAEMNAMAARLDAATEARRKAEEELRHADRLSTVGKLASGVAHELGTPLNVAAARARMIVAGRASPDSIVENAQIIGEQCSRMTVIIRQLLDFARSKTSAKRAPVDLVGLTRETLALLEPIGSKRMVALETDVPGEPVTVAGDRMQLQQVITNIVMNGIQAMPEGGRLVVGLSASAAPGGTFACWSVRDEGVGIPHDVVAHVFEPFFTTKGVGEGTGLGLSVAFGIVKEHGGWIDVDTEEGRGSRFCVYLPIEARV